MPQAKDEAGNIWEVDAQGNAVRLIQAAGGAQMPTKPGYQFEEPQAAANVEKTVTDIEGTKTNIVDTQADNARADRQLAAELYAKGLEIGPDGKPRPIPNWTPPPTAEKKPEMSDNARSALELLRIIDGSEGLQEQFEQNFTGTSPSEYTWFGLNPNAAPYNFADKANAALPYVKKFMRTPGEGANSDKDQAVYERLLPSPNVRDSQNVQRIEDMRQSALSVLRQEGIDISGYDATDPQKRGTVWEQNRLVAGARPQAAAAGSDKLVEQLPPEMQAEYGAFLQQWMGNPDPAAMAAKRVELDLKYGYQSDPAKYFADAQTMAEAIKAGGATVGATLPGVEREMTTGAFSEQARNDAVNNPVAAALVGATDMGSFGGLRALAGDDLDALAGAQPEGMLVGQIGGAITGTGLIGRGVREATKQASRYVPKAEKLLEGGGRGLFGRNVATDVAYSGTYGGVSGEGAGQDALLGGIGSIAGQGLGRGLGAAVGGANLAPAVEALRARNIPMTMGQKLGGFAKSVEDKATSMPLVGDMIAARRMEGLQSFNREAMREAGSPIGFNPGEIGREGIDQMVDAVGNAYDQATAGANVPFDGAFIADMGRFGQAAQSLPRDFRVKAARAVENRIAPLTDTGAMSGEQYQQAVRGLKGYKAETSKPGFEQDYRDALTIAQDALTEQMRRGGGQHVVEGLDNANAAYRGIKTVEDAAMRADGAGYTFTPSQLQDALKATQRKFPGTSPLSELADAGQEVLPSAIPDSGTAGRAAQMLAGGGLIGLGTGAGALAGGGEGAQTGALSSAALTALLMLGGTRGGQKALDLATISRPPAAKRLGEGIRKRKGLFGSAALPLLIAN